MKEKKKSLAFHPIEHKRDTYGFVVRPQHLKRYQEYANIFKEEEEERSDRWNNFLEQQAFSAQLHFNGLSKDGDNTTSSAEASDWESTTLLEKGVEKNDARSGSRSGPDGFNSATSIPENEVVSQPIKNEKTHKIQIWGEIRPSLGTIEQMMSVRVMKSKKTLKSEQDARTANQLGLTEDDSEDEFYDLERSDSFQDATFSDTTSVSSDGISPEPLLPWKEELESLVRGGVPMALRGELWQAFVGARVRRVGKYYQDLLVTGSNTSDDKEHGTSLSKTSNRLSTECTPELWKAQIEKDLPRTFPGHPALDEDGRNALRRLLTAYARHNPSVGYCQAMNFFAGLLLLLMPEENAFWTLMAIIDDYFDGYYSEEMTESQVDQLVFEELMRERLPTLVNHLDHLGVQVPWFTGPWFLSIFVNMLPWESVFRVWDVLLFEGNRVMLFRTALALMELYGPALITTKDAGDAVTLMQSLTSSTFDSSQLVLTASMGYQAVNEVRLQELRDKHRPSVIASMEERSKGLLATRILKINVTEGLNDMQMNGNVPVLEYDFLNCLTGSVGVRPAPNLHEEVASLKVQIGRVLQEKNSAIIRAEELETALVEMVKQDNRHQLNSKVEMLEQELDQLQKDLTDKQQQEEAMIQVLMRVEHEQRETEDARILAEQHVTAQKDYAHELRGKYEETMSLTHQMEKRVIMAESMLEATLQYQSGQVKGLNSPRSSHVESSSVQVNQQKEHDVPTRKFSLLST